MDDVHLVGCIQRQADLFHDVDSFFRGKLFALVDEAAQILTLDEFHGDELHAITFAQVIDANHIAMCDPLREQELFLEAFDDRGMLG